VPGQHGADRLDSEPFLLVIDERDFHDKRGSSLFDPLRSRRRRPTAPTRIDIGLLHRPAQHVRIHTDPRLDPHRRAVQGQLMRIICSGSSFVWPALLLSAMVRNHSQHARSVFGSVGCGGSWRPPLTDRPFP
jgi:hypothetical protein